MTKRNLKQYLFGVRLCSAGWLHFQKYFRAVKCPVPAPQATTQEDIVVRTALLVHGDLRGLERTSEVYQQQW